jgi:hypothetical protein
MIFLEHNNMRFSMEKYACVWQIKHLELEHKVYSSKVDRLLKKHDWIAIKKQLLGMGGLTMIFQLVIQEKQEMNIRNYNLNTKSIYKLDVIFHCNELY